MFLGHNTDWPYHHYQRWYRIVAVPVTVVVTVELVFVTVEGTVVVVPVVRLIIKDV